MRSSSVTVRVVLPDEPGTLGRIASGLGGIDVDIRSISVMPAQESRVVDDLLLTLPEALDLSALTDVLYESCALEVDLGETEPRDPDDDLTALGLRLAANLVRTGAVEETLAQTVRLLACADDAWVVPLPEDPPTELLDHSGSARIPVSEHAGSIRGRGIPGGDGSPWVLSVPSAPASALGRLAVALRGRDAFRVEEIERIRALLQLVDAIDSRGPTGPRTDQVPPPSSVHLRALRDGRSVAIRRVRGDDALGILRMHARCSEQTLRRRFFSAVPSMPMRKLRWFTRSDPATHAAYVAVHDGEIVGIAQLVALPGGDDAEIGMLVEDALQGQRLGRVLLEHLIVAGRSGGYRRLVAETLPDNAPMAALLRRAGAPVVVERSSSGLRFELDPWATTTDTMSDDRLG